MLTLNEIEDITWGVVNRFVIPDFLERGHDASGNWRRNVNVRAEKNKGIISAPLYTGALVEGRQPNENQNPEAVRSFVGWFAPSVIEPWMMSKGINLDPYAIAYNIATRGTTIYRRGGSDFLEILNSQEVRNFVISELKDKMRVRVASIIKEELKKLRDGN